MISNAYMWTPFAIDDIGGELKTKREHELLSSMTKGEIVETWKLKKGSSSAQGHTRHPSKT